MAGLIEDYAIIGDMQSAALIGRDGSVDWLCVPRFDSSACMAALLGDASNGQWRICPTAAEGPPARRGPASRRYEGSTLILETEWRPARRAGRVHPLLPPTQNQAPVPVRSRVRQVGAVRVR